MKRKEMFEYFFKIFRYIWGQCVDVQSEGMKLTLLHPHRFGQTIETGVKL